MKIAGLLFADFAETFLGGPSQLLTTLHGRPVIAHAIQRMERTDGLDHRVLVVRQCDQAAASHCIEQLGCADRWDVLAQDSGARPRRGLHQSARKWNLESWRGGLLGATWFDEFVDVPTVGRVLNHYRCGAVLCADGHQAALSPEIATAMVRHQREYCDEAHLVFTQSPPGLAGICLTADAINEVLSLDIPIGLLLSYRPELAQLDPITKPMCLHVAPEIGQTRGRLSADTRRGREQLAAAFSEVGEDATAEQLCAWVARPENGRAGGLPVEIELELTTSDPFPESRLRPRGRRVPSRELTDLNALGRVFRELATYDDRLVFLAGHGDPLLHRHLSDVLKSAREAGICGIGIATPGLHLTDERVSALIDQRVDVVELQLDATSAPVYAAVHGNDQFEAVSGRIKQLTEARRTRNSPQPLPVPSLTRCVVTLPQMEEFFDGWIRKVGSAVIQGYNDYGGLLPKDGLLATVAPIRRPCRRISERLTLLADGTVARCHQDVAGRHALGNWRTTPLREIWAASARLELATAHARLEFSNLGICADCNEWGRY